MSTLPVHRFSQAEYLAFEREAETKHEFADGQIYDMSGGTLNHSLIAGNLITALGMRLKGKCRVHTSDTRVCIVPGRLICYPDVIVACEPPKVLPDDRDTLTNPSLLAEVLSPSTESYDRGHKSAMFRQVYSLHAYLLVSQKPASVEHWERQPDGGWAMQEITGPGAHITLRFLDIELPLSEVYAGVE
jgi:Uma2 family endonuclease